ncbi:MAG: hypothetical protein RIQ52_1303 [Pseudomonadota bacterium]|jgi:iron-sulfur cluster assembly protein
MSVTLTSSACRQIQKQLDKRGKGLGLRLGVRKAGCSGYTYVIDYADTLADNDQIFEQEGVRVIIDSEALPYLEGLVLDYTREGINEAFRFNNPNATGTCGCGESFAT